MKRWIAKTQRRRSQNSVEVKRRRGHLRQKCHFVETMYMLHRWEFWNDDVNEIDRLNGKRSTMAVDVGSIPWWRWFKRSVNVDKWIWMACREVLRGVVVGRLTARLERQRSNLYCHNSKTLSLADKCHDGRVESRTNDRCCCVRSVIFTVSRLHIKSCLLVKHEFNSLNKTCLKKHMTVELYRTIAVSFAAF